MQLLIPARDTCFWPQSPHLKDMAGDPAQFGHYMYGFLWAMCCEQLKFSAPMQKHVQLNMGSTNVWVGTEPTVYPKKYAQGFVVLCVGVVMQSFIMNSHEVFIHIHQGCFAGTGAIVRLPQCQWSKPDGYGKISQCITTTKHSKAKTVCIFLGIYCTLNPLKQPWPNATIFSMGAD